ncbi:DoxX family protein [Phytomonospora sp. NPDC050363]|uniref:DoxX family protein n=1 Tax=Phytomonospora sp. NPDC050363 TaxID=3155642 RepID=UPI0033E895C5
METALWIGQILLAALGLSGLFKATAPIPTLREKLGAWVDDFPPIGVRLIGWSEVAAMFALILPPLLDVATILTPLAATGLALMMVGAAIVHLRHKEAKSVPVNVVLFAVAVFVAWGRFGPYAF